MIKERDEEEDISAQQKFWDVAWAINHRAGWGDLEAHAQISSGLWDALDGLSQVRVRAWVGRRIAHPALRFLGNHPETSGEGTSWWPEAPVITGLSRLNCHFAFLQKQCFMTAEHICFHASQLHHSHKPPHYTSQTQGLRFRVSMHQLLGWP